MLFLRKLIYYAVVGVGVLTLFLGIDVSVRTVNAATVDDQVVTYINTERQKNNLSPLNSSDKLSQASQKHNSLMSQCESKYGRTSCFVHTVTLMGEVSLLTRIKDFGYNPQSVAENIAWGYTTSQSVVSAWMGSSGHRANILGNYKDIGCNYLSPYWTCDFGKSYTAGTSATPTPIQSGPTPTRTPTPTITNSPTPVLNPIPVPTGKPWWCIYATSFNLCQ